MQPLGQGSCVINSIFAEPQVFAFLEKPGELWVRYGETQRFSGLSLSRVCTLSGLYPSDTAPDRVSAGKWGVSQRFSEATFNRFELVRDCFNG
jgi:hypothetical protein